MIHRQHAEVEDRVKTLKATGGSHLPFRAFAANAAWFELALVAHDIMVWTQQLALDGEHADLRTQTAALPHPPRRRAAHPPRPTITLHLPADWPWTAAILRAFQRLQDLPAYGARIEPAHRRPLRITKSKPQARR